MSNESWPRWRYHKELLPEGKIVKSAAENEKLGKGWVDSPADFESKPEPVKPPEKKNVEVEPEPRFDAELESKPEAKKLFRKK